MKEPKPATLAKYGLSIEDWRAIIARQGGTCAVCRRAASHERPMNIDHEHVAGWKKMPPEERKQYVRAVLCYWCNKSYAGRGITISRAENVLRMLRDYEARRPPRKGTQ